MALVRKVGVTFAIVCVSCRRRRLSTTPKLSSSRSLVPRARHIPRLQKP